MRYAIFLLLLVVSMGATAQNFQIGHTAITFQDPSRNNRSILTEIYYPAATPGDNVPVGGNQSYPVVVFGHGFVMVWSAYQNIWEGLTPKGYIVLFPRTEGSIFPSHTEFARDMAFLVTAMQNQNNQPSSLFYGRVSGTSAVAGHSMGGGSALLSSQYNANITAIAALAPAETNPSAITACSNISKPVLLIAGTNDCVVPTSGNAQPMFNALASPCKALINLNGANHCQFAEYNFNCSLGESCSATINADTQQNRVNRLLLPWLNYYLKNQCAEWNIYVAVLANPANGMSGTNTCPPSLLCGLPTGLNTPNIGPTNATLSWNPVSCALRYKLRYRPTGSTTWISANAGTNTKTINGLLPGTGYQWQVKTKCNLTGAASSGWSALANFTTPTLFHDEPNHAAKPGQALSVWPNPAASEIQLTLPDAASVVGPIHIYNTLGASVRMIPLTEPARSGEIITIPLDNLSSGCYFVCVMTSSGVYSSKILKNCAHC